MIRSLLAVLGYMVGVLVSIAGLGSGIFVAIALVEGKKPLAAILGLVTLATLMTGLAVTRACASEIGPSPHPRRPRDAARRRAILEASTPLPSDETLVVDPSTGEYVRHHVRQDDDGPIEEIVDATDPFVLKTSVAGVSRRQDVARQCRPGDILELRREPNNQADSNAVMVIHPRHGQVGYISAFRAATIALLIDRYGFKFSASVLCVTGWDKENLGVNIKVRGVPRTWAWSGSGVAS
ncbi:MAG: HIRAN domain-containing protein [Phycisphaerales bacterium]